MRLLLVRHAETANNRDGLVQGRADHPLTATGIAQAEALADRLRDLDLGAVYSSPLQRAMQTAAPIAATHGLPIQSEEALVEMDVGELDGLSSGEMRERYPEVLRAWAAGEAGTLRLPGGESLQDVQDRAGNLIDSLRQRHPDQTILCVTHSFVALCVLCRALALPVGRLRRLRQSVCGLSVIEFRAERVQIVRLNDTCHLIADGEWSLSIAGSAQTLLN